MRLIALLLLMSAGTLGAQVPAATRAAVDGIFRDIARTDGPGCAVGVAEQGRTLYERGYGMANLETGLAITPQSIFHVASVSKQFAALSVALLAADGRLSLDDDVRRHVPEIPDYGRRMTIRQLIHHTSGLRDQWSLLSMAGWRFPSDLITTEDVLKILARQRGLNFVPGDEYLYSNSGYTLLAVIVQRVSGSSLQDFAEARLFGPLGMRQTHFHDDFAMVVPGRTSAYVPRGSGWRVSIPTFDTYGATSLFTTTGDLLRWMNALDAARREPGHPLARVVVDAETSGLLNDGTAINYGYGLMLRPWRGIRTIGHSGADAGYRAFAERYPDFGVAVTVLCNAANADPASRARRVAEAVLGDRLPREMVNMRAEPHRPSAAVREQWAGTYRDTVSQQVLRVRVQGDTVWAGSNRLEFGSDTTATTESMDGWFSLQPRGAQTTLRVNPRGLRQVVFVRQPAPFPTLGAYAGTYRSEELDATYTLSLRDEALQRQHRKMPDARLEPAGRDVFTLGGSTYLFERDRRGRVTGFTLNDGRVRGVRFVRVP